MREWERVGQRGEGRGGREGGRAHFILHQSAEERV